MLIRTNMDARYSGNDRYCTLYRLICCYESSAPRGISFYQVAIPLGLCDLDTTQWYNMLFSGEMKVQHRYTVERVPFHICHLPYYVEDELHETLKARATYETDANEPHKSYVAMIQWAQKTFDPDYVELTVPQAAPAA